MPRPLAEHTVQITFEPAWGPDAALVCHGNEESACWWYRDSEDESEHYYGKCVLAEWNNDGERIISGTVEVKARVVSWGEEPELRVGEGE